MEPDDQNHLQFLIEKHPPVAGDWGDWWELGTGNWELNHCLITSEQLSSLCHIQQDCRAVWTSLALSLIGLLFLFLFFLAEHMHAPSLKQQKSHINFIVFFFPFFLFSSIIVDVLPIF